MPRPGKARRAPRALVKKRGIPIRRASRLGKAAALVEAWAEPPSGAPPPEARPIDSYGAGARSGPHQDRDETERFHAGGPRRARARRAYSPFGGAVFAAPLETPTRAGRSTRSPIFQPLCITCATAPAGSSAWGSSNIA